jgi:hypothetical protein
MIVQRRRNRPEQDFMARKNGSQYLTFQVQSLPHHCQRVLGEAVEVAAEADERVGDVVDTLRATASAATKLELAPRAHHQHRSRLRTREDETRDLGVELLHYQLSQDEQTVRMLHRLRIYARLLSLFNRRGPVGRLVLQGMQKIWYPNPLIPHDFRTTSQKRTDPSFARSRGRFQGRMKDPTTALTNVLTIPL